MPITFMGLIAEAECDNWEICVRTSFANHSILKPHVRQIRLEHESYLTRAEVEQAVSIWCKSFKECISLQEYMDITFQDRPNDLQ